MTGLASAPAGTRRRRTRWVPPLMAAALVVLFAALWSGLVHLGLPLPAGASSLDAGHGPMIVLGFLGTLIAMERAVALGKPWAYVAPTAAAAGGLAVLVGAPDRLGPALATLGGLALVAVFVALHRIQPSLHNVVLGTGACCWVVAAALWLAGWDVPRFVVWLAAFLVLTIAGERLELSRMTGATRTARVLFVAVAGVFLAGLVVSLVSEPAGVRVAGAGLLGLAAWLVRCDVARRTVRMRGVTRYMAVALLTGYGWLAAAGGLWVTVGHMGGGRPAYDAMLHAVFLGFVISMIFAHAPVIVPAVLGRQLPYHPVLYVPLALLHVTLLLRLVGGDALGNLAAWQWGGILNELALLLYVALAVVLVRRGIPATAPRQSGPSEAPQSTVDLPVRPAVEHDRR